MLATNLNTNDKNIRKVLISHLASYYGKSHDTAIIPEFCLSDTGTRADIAVVNGVLHGYELKGDLDSLKRLPNQINGYSEIFDKVTIVVGKKHIINTIQEIPEWWGIILAKIVGNNKEPMLIEVREPKQNEHQNISTIVNLLWKDEIVDILRKESLYKKMASATKHELSSFLITSLDTSRIKFYVRAYLVNRNKLNS